MISGLVHLGSDTPSGLANSFAGFSCFVVVLYCFALRFFLCSSLVFLRFSMGLGRSKMFF